MQSLGKGCKGFQERQKKRISGQVGGFWSGCPVNIHDFYWSARGLFTSVAPLAGKTRQKTCTRGHGSSTLEIVGKWVYFGVAVVVIGVAGYFVYLHRAWLGLGSAGGGVPTEVTNTDLEPAHLSWRAVDRAAGWIRDRYAVGCERDPSSCLQRDGGRRGDEDDGGQAQRGYDLRDRLGR